MKGTGIILPIKDKIAAWTGDSPKDIPTGIAPLSSIIGNTAVKITVSSIDMKFSICLVMAPNDFTFFSILYLLGNEYYIFYLL